MTRRLRAALSLGCVASAAFTLALATATPAQAGLEGYVKAQGTKQGKIKPDSGDKPAPGGQSGQKPVGHPGPAKCRNDHRC